LREDDGSSIEINNLNIWNHHITPVADERGWLLHLPYRRRRAADHSRLPRNENAATIGADGRTVLSGDRANQALAVMLPQYNSLTRGSPHIADALALLSDNTSAGRMLRVALSDTSAANRRTLMGLPHLPAPVRLGLEMALNEDAESRALEGELHLLEERWREAETIAAVADSLLLPESVQRRFETLKQRRSQGI
jgi:hypothetical protein